METEVSLGSVALSLAAAGFSVFPCRAGRKEPATRTGYRASTTDPATVRAWWRQQPAFNIGIDCGASGLTVVDCDPLPDAGPGVETGLDLLLDLADGLGQPRDWLWTGHQVITGRGGYHHYWRTPPGRRIRNSAGTVAAGVDVRSTGGYVVAPWSRTTAGHYRPLVGWPHRVDGITDLERVTAATMTCLTFRVADIPVLPDWLADLLDPPAPPPDPWQQLHRRLDVDPVSDSRGYGATALAREVADVSTSTPGTRNQRLHLAACRLGQLVAAGVLTEPDVTTGLDLAAERAGLPQRERTNTITSGLRFGAANPREVVLR